ncbi:hypothetical protein BCR44DRAFT_62266 [Catenaria anguillulae PL171]|uniref:Uncharacterized protein n=1 Tax=Catenaria anguillulae PL171 TaxID=765915 RepID=A0A1Y2I018_9FUNG|nr:hypothetical protein BCR44DRAFT_62266 [Catenaria anguillulae PL171]
MSDNGSHCHSHSSRRTGLKASPTSSSPDPDSSSVSCLSLSPSSSLSKARKRIRRLLSLVSRHSHSHSHSRKHGANDEQVPLAPLPPLQYAIHELGPLLHPSSQSAPSSPAQGTRQPTNHQRHASQPAPPPPPPSLKSILVRSTSHRSHHPPPPPRLPAPQEPPRHQPPAAASSFDRRLPMSSFSSTSDSSTSDIGPSSSSSTLPTTAADSTRGSADSGLAPSVTSAALAASDALALAVRTVLSDPALPSLDHRVSPTSSAAKRKSVRIDLEPAIGRAPKYDRSPDPANLSERLRHGRVTAAEHRRVLDEVLVLKKVARESYRKALGSPLTSAEAPPPQLQQHHEGAAATDFSLSLSEALAGSVSDTRDVVGALVATLAEFVVKASPTLSSTTSSGKQTDGENGLDDERVDLDRQDGEHVIPGHYPESPTLAITHHLYTSPVPTPATPASAASPPTT